MLKEVFMRLSFRALGTLLPFAFIYCAQARDGTHHTTAETHRRS